MSESHRPRGGPNEPREYEIRVEGHLHDRWSAWLNGMSIQHQDSGQTLLRGAVPDQAALHGLLARIRDLGLAIVSVQRMEDEHWDD